MNQLTWREDVITLLLESNEAGVMHELFYTFILTLWLDSLLKEWNPFSSEVSDKSCHDYHELPKV